jgi:hypothetical protein
MTRNPDFFLPRPSSPWHIKGAVRLRSSWPESDSSQIEWVGRKSRYLLQNSRSIFRSLFSSALRSPQRMCHKLNCTINWTQCFRLNTLISPLYIIPGTFGMVVISTGSASLYWLTTTRCTSRSEWVWLHLARAVRPGDCCAAVSPRSDTTLAAVLMAARQDVASEPAKVR